MADRKSVMWEQFRQFAHSLKSRGGLLGALVTRASDLAHLMGLGGTTSPASATPRAPEPPRPPEPRAPQATTPSRPLPGDDDEKTPVQIPTRPARVVNFPPRSKPRAVPTPTREQPAPSAPPAKDPAPPPAAPPATDVSTPTGPVAPPAPEPVAPPEPAAPAPAMSVAPPPEPPASVATPAPVEPPTPVEPAWPVAAPARLAEPVVEGFFVARIAGEEEVRRHHLTEASRPYSLQGPSTPGPLPLNYADGTVLLLPRDPHTLFVLWDFDPATRQRAAQGLEQPRAVLKLHNDQDVLLGTIDIVLESRGFYIGGLQAGQPYRVELHLVGRDGRSRRIGRSSNRLLLPSAGPSANTEVRFLRAPAPAVRRAPTLPGPDSGVPRTEPGRAHDYITWQRVVMPGSASTPPVPPPGPMSHPPPGGSPPGAPGGAPAHEYLHVPRASESSELHARVPPRESAPPSPGTGSGKVDAWSPGPGVASEFWWGSAGPAGSSELTPSPSTPGAGAGQTHGPVGWMWVHGPVGSAGQALSSVGPPVSSGQWVASSGPASGASEQFVSVPARSTGPGW